MSTADDILSTAQDYLVTDDVMSSAQEYFTNLVDVTDLDSITTSILMALHDTGVATNAEMYALMHQTFHNLVDSPIQEKIAVTLVTVLLSYPISYQYYRGEQARAEQEAAEKKALMQQRREAAANKKKNAAKPVVNKAKSVPASSVPADKPPVHKAKPVPKAKPSPASKKPIVPEKPVVPPFVTLKVPKESPVSVPEPEPLGSINMEDRIPMVTYRPVSRMHLSATASYLDSL